MNVDSETVAVFALASMMLIAVPGPAVLYIVTRSIHQGRRAGIASVLGIGAGARPCADGLRRLSRRSGLVGDFGPGMPGPYGVPLRRRYAGHAQPYPVP